MNVSCVIHSLDGGGAERVMAGLVGRLAARDHRLTLITLDDGSRDRYPVDPQVRRVYLNRMSTSRWPWTAVASNLARGTGLRRALAATAPQVVLSFCDRTNVLTLAATVGCRWPVVVAERSDPRFQPLPWAWRTARPLLYRRAAAVIALTQPAALALNRWNRRPALVVPSAVDVPPPLPADPLPADPLPEGRRRIVGVGRLATEKGFDRLIDAFAAVADRHADWDLVIAGQGPQRAALQAQVDRLGLTQRVEFCGWVRPIWPLLRRADLFALTSRHEGFPSALLEAMAAGVASLAVDCESGPREIIHHGVDGWLVSDAAGDELGMALERLISDRSLRQRLGAAASGVVHRFGWSPMVDAYEGILASVARPRP